MTFSVQMLKSTFLQLGSDLEEAGRVNGGSFWFTLRHILLPLMLPALAVVAVMVFGSVSRQVGSIVLLTTGESEPLSVLQMGYFDGRGLLGRVGCRQPVGRNGRALGHFG